MHEQLPAGDGNATPPSHRTLQNREASASLCHLVTSSNSLLSRYPSTHRITPASTTSTPTSVVMPKPPMLHVLQSGGDVQVINVHFETHNDAHVLIKLLGLCVVVVLLLITVFVFFGNGTFLDTNSNNGDSTSKTNISKMIFANYRSIAAAIWLIWYGIFCFWCWFARVAWGDIAVPEKCVIGFRRVRERSVVCWLPTATSSATTSCHPLKSTSSVLEHDNKQSSYDIPQPLTTATATATATTESISSSITVAPHWQLRIAQPVNA